MARVFAMSDIDNIDLILKSISLEELLQSVPDFSYPPLGALVEGVVIDISPNKILVDLGGVLTGIISGKEAHDSSDTADTLHIGDNVYASVIEIEDDEGMVVLSLRRASKERTWRRFLKAYENREIISVSANEANKGGLLLEVDGIKGFIPVSQLAPLHYPRVNGADSGQILSRLSRLVGEMFDVRIISIDRDNGKLILSEKAAQDEKRRQSLQRVKVGQKVKGVVSGVVNFGLFVAFESLEGLVHISEIAWGHVKDPSDYARLGDKVDVMVIGIEGEKISLSMKRLVPDPWGEVTKNFPQGKIVEGQVTRITPFGVFVKLSDEINGLIHNSEFAEESPKDVHKVFKIGQKINAKVINLDLEEHRIGLSLKINEKHLEQIDTSPESEKSAVSSADLVKGKKLKKKKTETSKTIDESKDESLKNLLKEHGVSDKVISVLHQAGFTQVADLKNKTKKDLIALEGIGDKTAEKILNSVG